jgi:hypothetical protein
MVAFAAASLPSTVACIVAAPAARADNNPIVEIFATVVSELLQLVGRLVSTLPALSLTVTLSCTDAPTRAEMLEGEIVTNATLDGREPSPGVVAAAQAMPAILRPNAADRGIRIWISSEFECSSAARLAWCARSDVRTVAS